MSRLNLSDAIDDLAPPPPPCYLNRMEWVQYLKAAAASQNDGESPKIILSAHGTPRINYDYPYCADCTQVHSLVMSRTGRCNPDFLKQQGATQP